MAFSNYDYLRGKIYAYEILTLEERLYLRDLIDQDEKRSLDTKVRIEKVEKKSRGESLCPICSSN